MEDIEEAFGEPLRWERLDEYKSSRIAVYLLGRSISDSEEILAETGDWMISTVVRLSQTVIHIVREVAKEVDREMAAEASLELLSDGLLDEDDEE